MMQDMQSQVTSVMQDRKGMKYTLRGSTSLCAVVITSEILLGHLN